jgi:deazaflavin-dependent oxidoreductase (nitroreductase family)
MWSRYKTLFPSDESAPGNTADAPRVASRQQRRCHPVLAIVTRLFNPLTARFAGSRWFALAGLVRHRGRRSGRAYATPVAARPTAGGFVVPLTFGEGADWYRNVQAAGGCVIRWRGMEYPLVAPEVVDWATVRSAFSPVERFLLPRFGITQYVRLQHAHRQA